MTESLIEWAVKLAAILDAHPGVSAMQVSFDGGGHIIVDDEGARFVKGATVLDIDGALGEEAYEVAQP